MQTRRLGNSDMMITPVGFGAWAIGGGDWEFAWGPQDDADSIAAIHRAVDLGVNWIDTAAVYGLGHSEDVVAKALKGMSNRPYVFTKCVLVWGEERKVVKSYKDFRREVEQSLKRLQVDVIDLYQCHWPVPENSEMEDGWGVMADLKAEGKVKWIGVSNYNVEQLKLVQKIAPVTSLQPPYSMINSAVQDEILPYCEQQGIGVINYSPMVSGLLSGRMSAERIAAMPEDDWRRRSANFKEPRLSRNLKLAALLGDIGAKHGKSSGEVAIAWTLRLTSVTGAIVGARNAKQVDGWIGAGEFRLSGEEVAQIQQFIDDNPMPS
jgi:aryl-alcohol dehydrogenase-like predicted oxidoreductase